MLSSAPGRSYTLDVALVLYVGINVSDFRSPNQYSLRKAEDYLRDEALKAAKKSVLLGTGPFTFPSIVPLDYVAT